MKEVLVPSSGTGVGRNGLANTSELITHNTFMTLAHWEVEDEKDLDDDEENGKLSDVDDINNPGGGF